MGYQVRMGTREHGFAISIEGFCFTGAYVLYDSLGDSIEGAEDKPWVTNQSLQLSKNQVGSYECDIPYTLWHDKYGINKDDLRERNTFVLVEQDDAALFIGYLTEKNLVFDRALHVYFTECLGALDECETVVDPKEYLLTCEEDRSHWDEGDDGEGTPSLFYKVLHDSNATNDVTPLSINPPTVQRGVKKDLSDDGKQVGTTLSFLQKYFLDEYDGYFYVSYVRSEKKPDCINSYINYELDITAKTQQTVEYGKNLLDLEVTEKLPSDFCNQVFAWGTNTTTKGWWIFKKTTSKRALAGAYNWDSINKYGVVSKELYVEGNATEDSLKKAAQEELDTHEQWAEVSITLTAFDRVDIGEATDRLGYMKKTKVLSGPHEVNGWYVCTKIDLDPASPASTQFTFGNPPKKLTDQQNKVKTLVAGTAVMVGGVIGYLNM